MRQSEGESHISLREVAETLEAHSEEILAAYEARLSDMDSALVAEAATYEQLRANALAILRCVVGDLRGREGPFSAQEPNNHLPEDVGISRARGLVHPSESLRAVTALSEAALGVLADDLSPSPTSRSEIAALALAIQKSIMERVARAAVSYVNYLLDKLHESHADERRRIGRELHDRVAHSIIVSFRNLELFEMYQERDPRRAEGKLEDAKAAAQQALKVTRELSRELRQSSPEGGLEEDLSNYLRLIVPPCMEAEVSVDGDESLIAPQVRGELFLILREAVRNAVAHSSAQCVRVELSTTRDLFRAVVTDDGRGFQAHKPPDPSRSTGLASMKERASLLGGTFNLTSRPGSGTRVEIIVPLPRGRP